jgi:hypothetical protein
MYRYYLLSVAIRKKINFFHNRPVLTIVMIRHKWIQGEEERRVLIEYILGE